MSRSEACHLLPVGGGIRLEHTFLVRCNENEIALPSSGTPVRMRSPRRSRSRPPYTRSEVSASGGGDGFATSSLNVTTDDGLVGWSGCCERSTRHRWTRRCGRWGPFRHRPRPMEPRCDATRAFTHGLWQFRAGTANFAWAGIDMALWDHLRTRSRQPALEAPRRRTGVHRDVFLLLPRAAARARSPGARWPTAIARFRGLLPARGTRRRGRISAGPTVPKLSTGLVSASTRRQLDLPMPFACSERSRRHDSLVEQARRDLPSATSTYFAKHREPSSAQLMALVGSRGVRAPPCAAGGLLLLLAVRGRGGWGVDPCPFAGLAWVADVKALGLKHTHGELGSPPPRLSRGATITERRGVPQQLRTRSTTSSRSLSRSLHAPTGARIDGPDRVESMRIRGGGGWPAWGHPSVSAPGLDDQRTEGGSVRLVERSASSSAAAPEWGVAARQRWSARGREVVVSDLALTAPSAVSQRSGETRLRCTSTSLALGASIASVAETVDCASVRPRRALSRAGPTSTSSNTQDKRLTELETTCGHA